MLEVSSRCLHWVAKPQKRFGQASTVSLPVAAVDHLVKADGASDGFVDTIRSFVLRQVPRPIVNDVLQDGYKLQVRDHIRQGGESWFSEDNDYTGGHHDRGPFRKIITIAEKIKDSVTQQWNLSRVWENAVVHEFGHVVAYLIGARVANGDRKQGLSIPKSQAEIDRYLNRGISESPEFKSAWQSDYDQIPSHLKQAWLNPHTKNFFYYYLEPDPDGDFQHARQETFAECVDILVRGKSSTYNYDNFQQYFPGSLKVVAKMLQKEYEIDLMA